MRLAMALGLCLRRASPLVPRVAARRATLALGAAADEPPHRPLGDFFAVPPDAAARLGALGLEVAAPVQAACWTAGDGGAGAARGESLCLHAPTGTGKTLALQLPAVAHARWRGRSTRGRVVVLAPTRELVAQHAAVLGALVGEDAVAAVTTSTLGAKDGPEALADRVARATAVAATPGELCAVLEHRPALYGSLGCEALVLDELDLLMPARHFGGKRASRWQDKRAHPAEALARLVGRRSNETLQVLAGSATLDNASKKKLERALKGSIVALPLRTVRVDGDVALTVKTAKQADAPANSRTTLTVGLTHAARAVPNKADAAALVDAALGAAARLGARVTLVFVCSSSGLKVRGVADALRALPGDVAVLSDALFPSSQRNRRRGYATATSSEKRAREAAENAATAATRAAGTGAAAAALAARVAASTPRAPLFLVADQAVTRGLHVDAVDAVLILGKPANADTYLHLAGRAGRDPLRRGAAPATVVTVAKTRDAAAVKAWLAGVGADLVPFPTDASPE